MTRPVPWRRSTAAERRANRAAFKELKAACAANPSEAILKRRAKSARDGIRSDAQRKLRRALAGSAIAPFTAAQLATIKPHEHDMLRAEVMNRLGQLSTEERKAVNANQHLILAMLSVAQLRAVARPL